MKKILPVMFLLLMPCVFSLWGSVANPTYYWQMNQTGTDTKVLDTMQSRNITANFGSWHTGILGNSFLTNNVTGRGITAGLLSTNGMNTNNFSFSLWVKFNNTRGEHPLYKSAIIYAIGSRTILGFDSQGDNACGTGALDFWWQSAGPTTNHQMCLFVPNLQQWYNFIVTYNDKGNVAVYVNGTLFNETPSVGLINWNTAQAVTIGYDSANTYYVNGSIDEAAHWKNYVLTPAEALNIYSQGGNTSGANTVNLILYENYSYGYEREWTSQQEQDDFYTKVNYTNNAGAGITGATCMWNATNISASFHAYMNNNFTISDTVSRLSLSFTENSSGLLFDAYQVKLCYPQNAVGADVYINNNLYKSYPSIALPSCSGNPSYFEAFEMVYAYNNTKNINISVGCSECVNANKILKVVKPFNSTTQNYTLSYYRNFQHHAETLIDKANNGVYYYDTYPYAFFGNNTRTITARCNADSSIFTYTPKTRVISLAFAAINNYTYSPGIKIEQPLSVNITSIISGDLPIFINFSILRNGTLIKNATTTYMSLSNIETAFSGIYNLSLYVIGYDGSNNILHGYFILNDTIKPALAWSGINDGDVLDENTDYNFSVSAYDVDLYGLNVTIYYMVNDSMRYSFQAVGIGSTDYTWSSVLAFSARAYNITAFAVDSHTAASIPEMDITASADKLIYDNRIKIYAQSAISSKTVKQADRYNFQFTYPKGVIEKIFYISSNERLRYLPNSRYVAHFVDYANRKWIDMEGLGKNPIVERVNDTDYKVTFYSELEQVSFNSIGGLNIIEESRLFSAAGETTYTADIISFTKWFNFDVLDLSSTSGVLLYFFLILVWMFLIIIAFYTEVPVMFILSSIYGLFISIFTIAVLSSVLGVILFIFTAVLFFFSVIYMRD